MRKQFGIDVADQAAEWLGYDHSSAVPNAAQNNGELPELVVNATNLAQTAEQLAALIATKNDFLSNGNMPVQVVVNAANNMPRAIEASTEAVRIYAHKICRPVKIIEAEDRKSVV